MWKLIRDIGNAFWIYMNRQLPYNEANGGALLVASFREKPADVQIEHAQKEINRLARDLRLLKWLGLLMVVMSLGAGGEEVITFLGHVFAFFVSLG